MAVEIDSISAKLEQFDELVSSLEAKVKKTEAILELPKAVGAIADCQKAMLEILSGLKNEGMEWWMDGRTLLASARTQELLPWESMLEIGMLEESWNALSSPEVLSRNAVQLEESVLTSIHSPAMGAMKPQIRINVWDRNFNGFIHEGISVPFNVVLPLKERKLAGLSFPAPANTLKYLNILYGSSWIEMV